MESYYQISVDAENLTSYVFYEQLLPRVHEYFVEGRSKTPIINLTNVRRISPFALPNLIVLGLLLKKEMGAPVALDFTWNPKLVTYLNQMSFFDLVRKNNAYSFDEGQAGGIDGQYVISNLCQMVSVQRGDDEDEDNDDSAPVLRRLARDYKEQLRKELPDGISTDTVLNVLAEICHNGVKHSGAEKCFASFQVHRGGMFQISVSDGGIGLYKSFCKKLDSYKADPKAVPNPLKIFQVDEMAITDGMEHLRSILEAVFFRKMNSAKPIYGIHSVLNDILPLGGIVRVHTSNTQIVFTQKNYKNYIQRELTDAVLIELKSEFMRRRDFAKSDQYSPLRVRSSKLSGVHVEIEIPFIERGR
jgi:hypothetical protein